MHDLEPPPDHPGRFAGLVATGATALTLALIGNHLPSLIVWLTH
jgi:hypothetical protein